jgi:uncharacterized membrane protein
MNQARKWSEMISAMRETLPGGTTRERYEVLRERYADGSIELEDFTAEVVTLLREGL